MPALSQRVREEAGSRAQPQAPECDLRLVAALRAVGVGGVHVHRHTVVAAKTLGESEVVAVAVGEHDAADVVDRASHPLQFALQIAPVSRQSRVDHGDPFGGVDEVGGDDVVADAVQMRCELHGEVS